jgi:hypothetical protein
MHNSIEDQETNANTAAFEGGDSAAEWKLEHRFSLYQNC